MILETMQLPKCRQLVAPEAIDRLHGRIVSREEIDGAVRLKIVLSKKELKKMVRVGSILPADQIRQSTGDQSFEQMLHVLRKRHMRRVSAAAAKEDQLPEWQPALQSIPEEIESYRIEE